MSNKSDLEDIKNLGDRLKKAQSQRAEGQHKGKPRGKAMGMAYRMSFELVIAVMVGAYLGWLLDGWFDTKPLFMLVLFFFGMAAGIVNVVRYSNQMAKEDKAEEDKKGFDKTTNDEQDK